MAPEDSANGDTVVVAGHLVYDEIVFADGNISSAFGGISYNLAALCAGMKRGRIVAICELGSDRQSAFETAFGNCPLLNTSLIKQTSELNVVNRLVYRQDGIRDEWNSRIPEPLSLEKIPQNADGVLLNFISGDDFELDDLSRFRNSYAGPIYMDYHSLSLGRSPDGCRYLRKHRQWQEHIACADILQMNLAELESIFGHGMESESIPAACETLHRHGPRTIIITMGEKGTLLSTSSGAECYRIPPSTADEIVDPTGCGDTLAAIAFREYLHGGDILKAVVEGSRWAAAKASFSGIGGFAKMENLLSRVADPPRPIRL